jgi:hypothetical protein
VEAYSGGGVKGRAPTPQAQQGGKKVIIDRLRVEQGKLYMSAVPLKGEPVTVALPDIELKNLGKGGQGVSLATVVEKVLVEVNRQAAKAVANVDLKGMADKARKEAEGAGAGAIGGKLKGIFGR